MRKSAILSLAAVSIAIPAAARADDTAPYWVTASGINFGVLVTFSKCASSDASNCWDSFSIYRSQSGSAMTLVNNFVAHADATKETWNDQNAPSGKTYVYKVCKGGDPATAPSCATSNTLNLVPSTPPPPPPPHRNICNAPWGQPANIMLMNVGPKISVKWTNPPMPSCNAPRDVSLFRGTAGSGDWQQIADIPDQYGLPQSFMDSGPLQPHTPHNYRVCIGDPIQAQLFDYNTCVRTPNYLTSSGAAPVLTATRTGATTVKLTLTLDNALYLGSPPVEITRSVMDNSCGQGTTLANGLQGCPTHVVAGNGNGRPVNVKSSTTLDINSLSMNAPPIGNGPWTVTYVDSTAQPNETYGYEAQVTWSGPVTASSDAAYVPSYYATAPQGRTLPNGIKP